MVNLQSIVIVSKKFNSILLLCANCCSGPNANLWHISVFRPWHRDFHLRSNNLFTFPAPPRQSILNSPSSSISFNAAPPPPPPSNLEISPPKKRLLSPVITCFPYPIPLRTHTPAEPHCCLRISATNNTSSDTSSSRTHFTFRESLELPTPIPTAETWLPPPLPPMSPTAMTEYPASSIPETYLSHPESQRAEKRKAEQALENDRRLLSQLQAHGDRLRVAMASFDTVTRQEALVAAKAALRALDGQGNKHYTFRQGYQDMSARIGNPPAYHLEAVAANKAAIAKFEQSLAQAKEAVASAIEKRKENWLGYHAMADELRGAESELAGLKKAINRGSLAINVLEAQLAVAVSGEQALFESGEEKVTAIINTGRN